MGSEFVGFLESQKISNKFLLNCIEERLDWPMAGVLQRYIGKNICESYDYGQEWLSTFCEKIGKTLVVTFPEDTWAFIGVLNVVKKAFPSVSATSINSNVIQTFKFSFPQSEGIALPEDNKVAFREFEYCWKWDPTVHLYVVLLLYRFGEYQEQPLVGESKVSEEEESEGEIEEEAEAEEIVTGTVEIKQAPPAKKRGRKRKKVK